HAWIRSFGYDDVTGVLSWTTHTPDECSITVNRTVILSGSSYDWLGDVYYYPLSSGDEAVMRCSGNDGSFSTATITY
ncbi:MAG: hypothetical protein GY820_24590, partial [Gammaproteobacteria bacterium]|nr:hypothetical protein [Gammaproteobacteria bacterium]MCP4490469.1 hypothetical protein [Gammaproteobacteria bacterium]